MLWHASAEHCKQAPACACRFFAVLAGPKLWVAISCMSIRNVLHALLYMMHAIHSTVKSTSHSLLYDQVGRQD